MNRSPHRTPTHRLASALALGFAVAFLPGCADVPTGPITHTTKPPPEPPAYPAARPEPLDPQLVADARDELLAAARSSDEVLRANAIEAMRETGGAAYAGHIVDALKDHQPVVRFAAAMAAGELRLAGAKRSLSSMVYDPDPTVRVAVRFALHRLGDTRLSHDFEEFALDPNPKVRGSTALALGLLGEKSALKILKVMRRDSHPAVRQQAQEAAWRLGDEAAMKELVGWTVSGPPDDRMLALLALAAPRNQRFQRQVAASLTTEYEEVNLVAARAMGMLGRDDGYGVAQKGAASRDPRHRWLAARAFGAIGRTDAQRLLRDLLRDENPTVRLAAASAVLQLDKTRRA